MLTKHGFRAFQWATLPNSLSTFLLLIAIGLRFQWATLPNSLSTNTSALVNYKIVSMGDFAQLPVNRVMRDMRCLCMPFQWATLPNSLSTRNRTKAFRSMFQWATLPNSLSTSAIGIGIYNGFNGRLCPTPCQLMELSRSKRLPVSMGDFAQLPVNRLLIKQFRKARFNGRHCPTPCQLWR